jgi:hypothetical protein
MPKQTTGMFPVKAHVAILAPLHKSYVHGFPSCDLQYISPILEVCRLASMHLLMCTPDWHPAVRPCQSMSWVASKVTSSSEV